jgi:hypothetical protein
VVDTLELVCTAFFGIKGNCCVGFALHGLERTPHIGCGSLLPKCYCIALFLTASSVHVRYHQSERYHNNV